MPKFFVPAANSPEQAEEVYAKLAKQNIYPNKKPGRLFKIGFIDKGTSTIATVGEDFVWPARKSAPASLVVAIIEANELVTVHTKLRGWLSDMPYLVSPKDVCDRVYFDDYPPSN
jgi:hypothetical protein